MSEILQSKPEMTYTLDTQGDTCSKVGDPQDEKQIYTIEMINFMETESIRSPTNPKPFGQNLPDMCFSDLSRSNFQFSSRKIETYSYQQQMSPLRSPKSKNVLKLQRGASQFKNRQDKGKDNKADKSDPNTNTQDFSMGCSCLGKILMNDYLKLLIYIFKSIRKSHKFNPSCLPQLKQEEKIDAMYSKFSLIFFNRSNPSNITSSNVVASLILTFWKDFTLMGCLLFFFFGIKLGSSMCIRQLLEILQQDNRSNEEVYLWTAAICGSIFVVSLLDQHFARNLVICYQQMRVIIMKHIHSKVSSLSAFTISQNNVGQILNLVSNDLKILETKTGEIIKLPILLFPTIFAAVLSYTRFGVYALVGLIFLVICVPAQAIFAKYSKSFFSKRAGQNDQRMQLTNEFLEGIRLIKLYSWESAFLKMLNVIRSSELRLLLATKLLQVCESSLSLTSGIISCFLIFWLVFQLGDPQSLTLANMFSTLDIFLFLRQEVISPCGIGITGLFELKVVMARIANILGVASNQMVCINYQQETDEEKIQKAMIPVGTIIATNYCAYWKMDKSVLEGLQIEINKGDLIAIIGSVGSGKSSLLSSCSGEMAYYTGKFWQRGRVALVEQEPFIFNTTIQENIVFGSEFDESLYQQVLEACNLERDIELMDGGDQAQAGEKGSNLSGGQRSRISLARALYSQAEIYLLDDPFSALDPRVTKKIFEKTVFGMLSGKTILLVTHSKDFMKKSDKIIALEAGQIVQQGTPEDLMDYLTELPSPVSRNNRGKLSPKARSRAPAFSRLPQSQASQLLIKQQSQQQQLDSSFNIGGRIPSFHSYQVLDSQKKVHRPISKVGISATQIQDPDENSEVTKKTYINYFQFTSKFAIFLTVLLFMSCEIIYIFFTQTIGKFNVKFLNDYPSLILRIGLLCLGYFLNTLIKRALLSFVTNQISFKLHQKMVAVTLRSKISYFDKTSLASILNRYSSDLSVLDTDLPKVMTDSLEVICNTLTLIFTIMFMNPYFIIVAIISAGILGIFFKFAKNVLILTKQFDLALKSQVFSAFNSSIQGNLPVRIYGQISSFGLQFSQVLNDSLRTSFTYWFSARGFGIYVNFVAQVASISGIFLALFISPDGPSMGSIITFFISLGYKLQSGLRQLIQLDVVMSSVQRVLNLTQLAEEPPLRTSYDKQFLSKNENQKNQIYQFPQEGSVEFRNVYMSYREDKKPVLQGVSFSVKAGEKTAFVGRTGAGKSSILQALFRMFELFKFTTQTLPSQHILMTLPDDKDGNNENQKNKNNNLMTVNTENHFNEEKVSIREIPVNQRQDTERDILETDQNYEGECPSVRIDGHPIDRLGVQTLRDGITIIPQVPFVFSGTIRKNIDPLEVYTDEKIWGALKDVGLKEKIEGLKERLDCQMSGELLSAGQKQMMCLSRAILKKTKLLVLDEITSNCDDQTEEMILNIIRKQFKDSTILAIAHRLITIADFDQIVVLDQGKVAEKGTPFELLKLYDGIFTEMVTSTGNVTAGMIKTTASQRFISANENENSQDKISRQVPQKSNHFKQSESNDGNSDFKQSIAYSKSYDDKIIENDDDDNNNKNKEQGMYFNCENDKVIENEDDAIQQTSMKCDDNNIPENYNHNTQQFQFPQNNEEEDDEDYANREQQQIPQIEDHDDCGGDDEGDKEQQQQQQQVEDEESKQKEDE